MRPASCLPVLLLLLAISTVYLFGDGWGGFYQYHHGHDWNTSENLALAENLSPAHNFLMFLRQYPAPDGAPAYEMYNRFPIGSFALIKLAISPFGDDLSAKLYAARMLMLLMFAGAAALAYLSLRRITASRQIAFAATLLAFSSYYILYLSDMVANDGMMDLFGIMLVFHGMTIYVQEGRFAQLLAKTCIALLIGWHIYALLLPFIVFGLGQETIRSLRGNIPGNAVTTHIRSAAAALIRSRYLRLGAIALIFGITLLSFNFANEYAAMDGEIPFMELSSVQSMIKRTGQNPEYNAARSEFVAWGAFLPEQFRRIGRMALPYAITVHTDGLHHAHPTGPLSLPYAAIGIAAAGASLLALLFLRRRRILLATLALSGLCWGIGMRSNTALHDLESIFYVGIPLVLFTLILLKLRQRIRHLATIAAMIALPVFALSAYHIAQTEAQARAPLQDTNAAVMSDFQKIQGITRGGGKKVYIQMYELDPYSARRLLHNRLLSSRKHHPTRPKTHIPLRPAMRTILRFHNQQQPQPISRNPSPNPIQPRGVSFQHRRHQHQRPNRQIPRRIRYRSIGRLRSANGKGGIRFVHIQRQRNLLQKPVQRNRHNAQVFPAHNARRPKRFAR